MAEQYTETDRFRGARFERCDLHGVEVRDSDVTGLRIVDSFVHDVLIAGDLRNVVVNDIDVTAFVENELDRRYPERAQARDVRTAADYRAAWRAIEALWAATVERARRLPDAALHEQVGGEWSFVETHRHLLFAGDAWVGSAVLEEEQPYHRLGYPASGYPPADAAALGIELDARPSLDEVLTARAGRSAAVGRVIDALTEAELGRVCTRKPSPLYPDQEYTVGRCIRVVLREEAEHRRYAERDLAALEAG